MQKILDIIHRGRSFLVVAHARPDGDSVGSMLALYHMLKTAGKEPLVYSQDAIPENYRFLPGSGEVVFDLPAGRMYDAVFLLDCSELDRVGDRWEEISKAGPLVNIDHHISNDRFTDVFLIDAHASSTAELLYRLAVALGWELSKEAADCLYTGILTDTGGFCYGNTGRDSLFAAADLVASGANPQWVSENVYESKPLEKIRLLARAMATMEFQLDGKVGLMVVTLADFAASGALFEHTEGFVDFPRGIRGVQVSVLFTEVADRSYKVSLRSKGRVNIEKVARSFGGGGHMNAAACRLEGELADVVRRVLEEIEAVLSE
ncbi:MAG TPA: bifunctional oligoribonuclease/PAP phosphatase NrnA [Syntrophales bacterium]|jgi:phosphoesterase RecJ-like protein|nr:bifunctional oligoribonuclease/PAP phosphatase NrnA [Syntrophales bacterium]